MSEKEECKKDIDNAKGYVAFIILPSTDNNPNKHQSAIHVQGSLRDTCAALEMGMKALAGKEPEIFKALKSYMNKL